MPTWLNKIYFTLLYCNFPLNSAWTKKDNSNFPKTWTKKDNSSKKGYNMRHSQTLQDTNYSKGTALLFHSHNRVPAYIQIFSDEKNHSVYDFNLWKSNQKSQL